MKRRHSLTLLALVAVAGIVPPGCEEGRPPEVEPVIEPGPVSMRRLTAEQYRRTVTDLFGDDIVVPALAEPDIAVSGLISVGATESSFSPRGVESAEAAAFTIAEQALETAERRARILDCDPGDTPAERAGCAESMVRTLGLRAWRRPLADDEVERIVRIGVDAARALDDFDTGMTYAVAALLQSPYFLYRTELGSTADGQPGPFDDFELATRLSYFLWNTTPDDALLDAAASGLLSTEEGLRSQAERLIDGRRAREGVRAIFADHLELYDAEEMKKDPTLFEHFSSELGKDVREETLRLIDHLVFDSKADFRDLMTTRETFINPRLAAIYGIPAPNPGGFARVLLPEDGQRAGLLGHASTLGLHSHQRATSATLRGAFVRKVLLCQAIPPAPVDVDTSIPEPSGNTLTLRDRVKEHLENPACASCHELTDPIGLGLENYDSIGRWRETDEGAAIDPGGEIDGAAFSDAMELGWVIREHERFAPCVVRTVARVAMGRAESGNEGVYLQDLSDGFADGGYRVKPLLLAVVTSPLFRDAGVPR